MITLSKAAFAAMATYLFLVGCARAHSFLIEPTADWTNNGQPECRIGKPDGPEFDHFEAMNCPGPCGETGVIRGGAEFFSESKGHTKLSRGQKLYMKWTKNNHQNGFVRFTLVPKSERMNKDAHNRFAFHYACWEAGEVGCEHGDECGTDEKNMRYQTEVEIPRIFPDGEYILGWSWYGGSKYIDGSEKAEYGDYWSCSNIEIHGGIDGNGAWQDDKNHEAEYTPVFEPGLNDKSKTQCKSAVNALGVCATEPCYARYEASWQVPAGFENGNTPPPVKAADVIAITGADSNLASGSQESAAPQKQSTESSHGNSNGGSGDGAVKVARLELVDTSDMSVVTSDFSKPIEVRNIRDHMTIRAIVEPVDKVEIVEFSVGNMKYTEGMEPYYIAGDSDRGVYAWTGQEGPPMNTDFALTVRATAKDGRVEEMKVNPHFVAN